MSLSVLSCDPLCHLTGPASMHLLTLKDTKFKHYVCTNHHRCGGTFNSSCLEYFKVNYLNLIFWHKHNLFSCNVNFWPLFFLAIKSTCTPTYARPLFLLLPIHKDKWPYFAIDCVFSIDLWPTLRGQRSVYRLHKYTVCSTMSVTDLSAKGRFDQSIVSMEERTVEQFLYLGRTAGGILHNQGNYPHL